MSLRARLSASLARPAPALIAGDDVGFDGDPVAAAVLVAVTNRAAPGVLLTRRTDTLARHAGQVAFPGGRVDPGDDGPVAAALREAEEEIGLPRGAVEVVGAADSYRTVTGFAVVPVVGIVPPDLALVPHEAEVAAVFEAPLAFLMDPANHVVRRMDWQGQARSYVEIDWQGWRIWGATAAMLVNLSRRLSDG